MKEDKGGRGKVGRREEGRRREKEMKPERTPKWSSFRTTKS